jgi:deoxycytidylate deaminase
VNPKHVALRVEQCLVLAKASNCPRRKFGALLIDPTRNVILADGYNGGPRGGLGTLCKGYYCERDGLTMDDLEFEDGFEHNFLHGCGSIRVPVVRVRVKANEEALHTVYKNPHDGMDLGEGRRTPTAEEKAREWAEALVAKTPPIKSGTMVEIGCVHAEMNVICNAAAQGTLTRGAWLILTGEPCLMCARLIHHAGIVKVLCVKGGFVGGDAGPEYLRANRVEVEYVEGPQDPRGGSDGA